MLVLPVRKLVLGLVAFFLTPSTILSQSPGGITTSTLKLWFKADLGVIHTSGQVSQWNDISTAGNVSVHPQKIANSHVIYQSSAANFNPTVLFDGTSLEQFKGSANNLGGTPTLFTVSRSINAGGFNPLFSNFEYDQSIPDKLLAKSVGPGLYLAADYYVVDASEAWIDNSANASAVSNQFDIISFAYENPTSTTNTRIYRNGILEEYFTGTGKPNTSNVKTIEIGGRSADDMEYPGRIFNGDLVEIIYFTNTLNNIDRQKVETYLAIKYGITLTNNYLSSTNSVIYDVSSYNNNIIGIGRDDGSALYQKQSKGENYNPILTIGLNAIAADNQSNTGTFATDQTTFITGSNNAPLTSTTTGVPAGIDSWLERKWKSALSGGTINNLLISIPDSYLGAATGSCELMLIMADDPAFTTNVQTFPMSHNGSSYESIINTITPGNRYFTFGKTNHLDFDFGYKQDICNPLSVQFFSAGGSTPNPYWSFGDGATAINDLNPVHIYTASGNYLARFSVSNGVCSDTIEKVIAVNVTKSDIVLTSDTTFCHGNNKQLRTTPALNFCWSPTTYLDDPSLPNPVSSATQNITYYFTAQVPGNNVITNGNFSAGNTGFTSQYSYANPNVTEAQYFVGANPRAWNVNLNPCKDHTTGTGNMLLVNGAPIVDVSVWTTTVSITPNTNYAFSTWIQDVGDGYNPALLQFSINGKTIGDLINAPLPSCTWTQFYTTWNSGNNTSATISIVNKNTQIVGNDFALDDISFAPVTMLQDSVVIKIEKPVVNTNNDTLVCISSPVQLNTTGAANYAWSPTTGLSNSSIGNPVAMVSAQTQYIVTGTTVTGCVAKDTVIIDTYTRPLITVTNDTAICDLASIPLSANGGLLYQWSPASTLDNPNIGNPIARPIAKTIYKVQITDANDCKYLDSVKVDLIPRPAFTASTSKSLCMGDTVSLSATGGDNYSWTPAINIDDPSNANPAAWPEATTQYKVYITEGTCNYDTTIEVQVNVNPKPVVTAQKTNDVDCITPSAQLQARGASTYLWSPVAAVDDPNLAAPLATINTTTTFLVKGTNEFGCFSFDTVTVQATQAGKPTFVLPNAFTPNHDGKNDCFGPRKWGSVEIQEFSIFNRWGVRIFTTKNPSQCWDGTYRGQLQDAGGYPYVIKAKSFCGDIVRTGLVMLIR